MQKDRTYVCIDLKSFYASVECRERGLDPMTTNLVVADPERSDKTICLAVSPAMKKLGVPGRCRVFEIPKGIEYIMAPPRMQLYIDYSAEIYAIYLKYISKEDIHVYSIDEVFMDVTDYLAMYQMPKKIEKANDNYFDKPENNIALTITPKKRRYRHEKGYRVSTTTGESGIKLWLMKREKPEKKWTL